MAGVTRVKAMVENNQPEIYQGQFGEFTITMGDRFGVIVYRGLLLALALCFATGVAVVLVVSDIGMISNLLTVLYWGFSIALGGSLLLIHIYLIPLHRTLQLFWLIGSIAAVAVSAYYPEPLLVAMYNHPNTLFGTGFTFAALTGIFFKEAFCFGRFETKFLTAIVPTLLLGHMLDILPVPAEKALLGGWAILLLIFVLRKVFQAIPQDIGDKSVFTYLKNRQVTAAPSN